MNALVLNRCDYIIVQDLEQLQAAAAIVMIVVGEIRRPTIHGLLPLGVLTGALLLTWGPLNFIEKIIQDFQNQET